MTRICHRFRITRRHFRITRFSAIYLSKANPNLVCLLNNTCLQKSPQLPKSSSKSSQKEKNQGALENEENADEVCLIAQKWWRSWCNYSKYPHSQIDTPDPDATKPGTIDNSELCSEDFALALDSRCQEDYDYL